MAKYNVTYACGHDQIIDMVGKDREWRLERESQKLCPACWYEERQKQQAQASAKAAEEAQEAGLPALQGTEKQVAWAETLRKVAIKKVTDLLLRFEERQEQSETKRRKREIQEFKDCLASFRLRTEAKWWIDNRDPDNFLHLITTEAVRYNSAKEEPPVEVVAEVKKSLLEERAEATVEPENKKTPVVAELRTVTIEGNEFVELKSEKSDIVRNICREQHFDFISSRSSWIKKITGLNGGVERLVEMGNILLNKGVPIRIYDPELRRRAVAGEYEQECLRWIKRSEDNKFIISETGAKNYYDAARRIRGSRWDSNLKCVVVPAENFEELQGFADRYGFRFSKQARELREEAIAAKNKIEIVAPIKKEKAPDLIGVKPGILAVPETVEIDKDLADE